MEREQAPAQYDMHVCDVRVGPLRALLQVRVGQHDAADYHKFFVGKNPMGYVTTYKEGADQVDGPQRDENNGIKAGDRKEFVKILGGCWCCRPLLLPGWQ